MHVTTFDACRRIGEATLDCARCGSPTDHRIYSREAKGGWLARCLACDNVSAKEIGTDEHARLSEALYATARRRADAE